MSEMPTQSYKVSSVNNRQPIHVCTPEGPHYTEYKKLEALMSRGRLMRLRFREYLATFEFHLLKPPSLLS